ncbi:pilus assembly PilX family protein [Paucibacter soli]|uniref:pilus assembly PilX family protein n=1 Tax=Paucibacter soli TaxID=3133433 RepID=UPI0030B7037C
MPANAMNALACPRFRSAKAAQQGAATLVTVMVLFFVLAMMAAYANRNLVFEQRIASNYFRSGVAAEAAESGIEWAIAMLNGGNVDASCQAVNAPGSNFRQRYLTALPTQGYGPVLPVANFSRAGCTANGPNTWVCDCPAAGAATSPAANASALQPSFGVRFPGLGSQKNIVLLNVTGCSSLLSDCATFNQAMVDSAIGQTSVTVGLGFLSALRMPPASPLVAALDVNLGTNLGLHNSDPSTNGLVVQTGGQLLGSSDRLTSVPGTPAQDAIVKQDANLQPATMFRRYFGMSLTRYQGQPNVRTVQCNGDCLAAAGVAATAAADVIWINEDATLADNVVLGSAAAPVLLIVNGNLTVTGPIQIHGVIYVTGNVKWDNASAMPSQLIGALVTQGSFGATGLVDLAYDPQIISILNKQHGAFVRIPGSWIPGLN